MRILSTLIIILLLGAMQSCHMFSAKKHNVETEGTLYIPMGASFATLMDSISPLLKNPKQFESFAKSQKLDARVQPGMYKISKEQTNEQLVDKLINGKQDPVKVMVANPPTIFHMAKTAARHITADSLEIVNAILENPVIKEKGLDFETAKMYFIPNTYHFNWITSGEQFVQRMVEEHDKFWTEERKRKMVDAGMSELEVYTLASIVQMEASKADEQPKVAQAYLNRLRQGRKLEADPTAVYAYKMQNGFTEHVQRVYHSHLRTPSEYNTYQVTGLPPAPIALPNPSAIDAVLEPEPHDYIFFCADPDRPGYHSFAKTYSEHQQNAAKYRAWLRANNIK
ncbi:MAG: endolytic transglycosylase MltG [Weeksellaceae bacterium]|nr:endolytic transglycosylase MltG [Weeksellaceae bacterium]